MLEELHIYVIIKLRHQLIPWLKFEVREMKINIKT